MFVRAWTDWNYSGAFELSLQTAFPLSIPSFTFHKESTMIKQMIKPGWISGDICEAISEDISVDIYVHIYGDNYVDISP